VNKISKLGGLTIIKQARDLCVNMGTLNGSDKLERAYLL
jgi:hypothetical protein